MANHPVVHFEIGCTNGGKTDYNIGGRPDKDCWDYKGGRGKSQYGWRFRKPAVGPFSVGTRG